MKFLFLVGVLCMSFLSVCGTFDVFNCDRVSQPCGAGGSCTSGSCVCTGTNNGYKCQDDTALADGTCGTSCVDCMNDNVCLCAADKYNGDTNECAYDRIQLICSVEGKMIINANLEGANAVFVGTETACPLDGVAGNGNIPAGWEGFAREISTPTDADCLPIEISTADGITTTCLTARVRYGASYWDALDGKITYCCAGTTVSSITVADLTNDDELVQGTTITPQGGSGDVDLAVKADGVEVTGPLSLGQTVTIEFRTTTFVNVLPTVCTLQEAETGAIQTNDLVTAGCATDFSDSALVAGTPGGYDLSFTVIQYVDSTQLFVVCDVLLCSVASECAQSCGTRKKRETPSNSTVGPSRTLRIPLTVQDPFQQNNVEAAVDNAVTKATNINLSAAVIGLAVVVLILLVACLLLGVCLINKRRAPDVKA